MNQRDAPLEIPPEVIRKLFLVMDQDMDDRIGRDELHEYVGRSGVPIPEDVVDKMFDDAVAHRAVVHDE